MKLYLILLLSTLSSCFAQLVDFHEGTLSNFQANFRTVDSANFVVDTFTINLTNTGPILFNGFVNSLSNASFWENQLTIRIDGQPAYKSFLWDKTQGSNDLDAAINYTFSSNSLTAGTHTVEIAFTTAWTWGSNGATRVHINEDVTSHSSALIFAPNEPSSGISDALDQLHSEFIAADDATKASLIALMQTADAALQGQIDALASQVSALESNLAALQNSQAAQDSQIADLTAQLAKANADLAALESTQTNFKNQITNLRNSIAALPNYSADINNLYSKLKKLPKSSKPAANKNNNDWIWGVGAGVAAGVGTAIIINQFSSRGEAAAENEQSKQHEKR